MGAVVVTEGAIVVELAMVEAVDPAIVVTVAPAMEVEGITSSATNESSVYLDDKQEPDPVGALPIAATMDATST